MPTKFGILALPRFQRFPRNLLPLSLNTQTVVHSGPLRPLFPTNDHTHWTSWLGTLEWEAFLDCQSYVEIRKEVTDANVVDLENVRISAELLDAYMSLMVTAPARPVGSRPLLLTGIGQVRETRLTIQSIQTAERLPQWFESGYMRTRGFFSQRSRSIFQQDLLDRWHGTFNHLRAFRVRRRRTLPLALALESLKRGQESTFIEFRLPLFIRASEGIMALRRHRTKQDFIDRGCQLLALRPLPLFISRQTDTSQLLAELFEVRNAAVHGMPFAWKLRRRRVSPTRMAQYEYLAEECARRCLRFALGSNAWIRHSGNREDLESWCGENWASEIAQR